MNRINVIKKGIYIKQFLILFIPFLLVFILIKVLISSNNIDYKILNYKNEEKGKVILKDVILQNKFDLVISDLRALSKNNDLFSFFSSPTNITRQNLEESFIHFSQAKKVYSQIRVLDQKGKELIRIDYLENGNAVNITEEHLQDKSDRYYFKQASKLEEGDIYISPLDLNIENGQIEVPYKPMIRFAIPCFCSKNNTKYLIILNYCAKNLIAELEKKMIAHESDFMLLNKDGYWFISPDKEERWGFMFEEKKHLTFANKYSSVWTNIDKNESGQIENENGIFTFKTFYIANSSNENEKNYNNNLIEWKIVSHVSSTVLSNIKLQSYTSNLLLDLFVFFTIIIFIAFISKLRMDNIFAAKQIKIQLEETKKLNNQILQSQEVLKERNKKKDRFLAILSHDLKNPLGALKNYAIILQEDYEEMDKEEHKTFINSIQEISESTLNLLLTLLDWGKMNVESETTEHKYIILKQVVENNISLLETQANSKNIELKAEIDDKIEVLGDKNMLNALFRNFINNAIKFTYNNGTVQVIAKMREKDVCICVKDNGVGLTPEQINKLLTTNEKNTTKGTNQEVGTGIGLMLCKEFIEKHGGNFRIESEPRKGSQFCFNLKARLKIDTEES